VTNTSALYREITEQGYRGSMATVAAYVAPFRPLGAAPPATPAVPKVRHIISWMLRRPDDLDADEQRQVKQVLAACPHLEPPQPTSAASPRCSPVGTASAWTPGWPVCWPMTCLTCTGSSEDSSAITMRSATDSHSRAALELTLDVHQRLTQSTG
jgi:hypothetical protein